MATLAQIGIADMRRPGVTDYLSSYAPNIAPPTGRNTNRSSSQYSRAGLVMGRYIKAADAFNSGVNPDYGELAWIGGSEPARTADYARGLYWNQLFCADPWKTSHTPGWINNTRVMMWGFQFWIKSKSTGQWTLRTSTDNFSGEAWSPNFSGQAYFGAAIDTRQEDYGYKSVRLVYDNNEPTGNGYWMFHGYAGGIFNVDENDIADVICLQKASLVVHDSFNADDRDYARFVLGLGGDWYPRTGTLAIYPGIGTSRHKLITAKWPNWQYLVMHTMAEDEWNATNGYPSVFDTLSEGSDPDDSGGGEEPGPEVTPQPVVPTRGSWFAKLTGGDNTWTTHGVANVASSKVRRRRGIRFWS